MLRFIGSREDYGPVYAMIITTIVDTIHRLFVSGSAEYENVPPSEVSGGEKTFFGIAVSLAAKVAKRSYCDGEGQNTQ